jgi:hypothetical protein
MSRRDRPDSVAKTSALWPIWVAADRLPEATPH